MEEEVFKGTVAREGSFHTSGNINYEDSTAIQPKGLHAFQEEGKTPLR